MFSFYIFFSKTYSKAKFLTARKGNEGGRPHFLVTFSSLSLHFLTNFSPLSHNFLATFSSLSPLSLSFRAHITFALARERERETNLTTILVFIFKKNLIVHLPSFNYWFHNDKFVALFPNFILDQIRGQPSTFVFFDGLFFFRYEEDTTPKHPPKKKRKKKKKD